MIGRWGVFYDFPFSFSFFFFFLGHNTRPSGLLFSLFTRIMYKIGPGSVVIRRSPVSCFYMNGHFFFWPFSSSASISSFVLFFKFFFSASVLVLKAGSYYYFFVRVYIHASGGGYLAVLPV